MPERPTDAEVAERMRGGRGGPSPEPRLLLPPGAERSRAKGSPAALKAAIDGVCDGLFNGCVRATSLSGRAGGEGTLVFKDGRPCLAAYESQARSIYGPRSIADTARLAASPMSTVTAVEFHPGAVTVLEELMEHVPSAVVYADDLEAAGLWPPSAARVDVCAMAVTAPVRPAKDRVGAPPLRAQAKASQGSRESLKAEIARIKGFVEALPGGVPPSLRAYDDWTIAERVVKGEKRTAPDGTPLVLIMGDWYVATPGDRKRFLNPWKG